MYLFSIFVKLIRFGTCQPWIQFLSEVPSKLIENNENMKLKLPVLLLCLTLVLLISPSCQKETDCVAIVKCQDDAGVPVSAAEVVLYAKVKNSAGVTYTADITATSPSDNAGEVHFTFKLPAIYDILATKAVGTKTITGVGIIKLEEGQTVEKTVTLR